MQQQRTKWDTALWVQRFERELAKRIAKRKRERRENVRRYVLEGGCVVLVPRYFSDWLAGPTRIR
jgi:hypothetical protein